MISLPMTIADIKVSLTESHLLHSPSSKQIHESIGLRKLLWKYLHSATAYGRIGLGFCIDFRRASFCRASVNLKNTSLVLFIRYHARGAEVLV